MSESELNLQLPADPPVQSTSTSAGDATVVALAHSVSGRVSGKAWKVPKTATVRSHLPEGVKTKKWEERMEKTRKEQAIKKLQSELKQEKVDDLKRYAPSPSLCSTQSDVPAPPAAARSPRSGKRPLKSGSGSRRRRRRCAPANVPVRCYAIAHLRGIPLLQMGARRAARLRRKMGRTKKISH
ncbi:hypothetical protein TRAPUB_4805 [Trametes pubescens]|uniref:rRNA-processing protein n=1 Tax=Trametes pubescens TaxID=154538 RepID=A0A1M2VAH8_TRAPU|nr:hypothetical protein TRAPUB_4805 [Trametes pubescens]